MTKIKNKRMKHFKNGVWASSLQIAPLMMAVPLHQQPAFLLSSRLGQLPLHLMI